MNKYGALRMTRRAAGVHLIQIVIALDVALGPSRGLLVDPRPEIMPISGLAAGDGYVSVHVGQFTTNAVGTLLILGGAQEHFGLRVVDDVGPFTWSEPVVERHRHNARLRCPEEYQRVLQAILGQIREAATLLQSRFNKRVGDLVRPDVGFGVGEAPVSHHRKAQVWMFSRVELEIIVKTHGLFL